MCAGWARVEALGAPCLPKVPTCCTCQEAFAVPSEPRTCGLSHLECSPSFCSWALGPSWPRVEWVDQHTIVYISGNNVVVHNVSTGGKCHLEARLLVIIIIVCTRESPARYLVHILARALKCCRAEHRQERRTRRVMLRTQQEVQLDCIHGAKRGLPPAHPRVPAAGGRVE